MPKECSCHSNDDCKAAEVESKARTRDDGEGHVQLSTGGTVETERNSDSERAEDETVDGLSPRRSSLATFLPTRIVLA